MCGVAGIVNWGDAEVLGRMTDVQVHRGPDDRGVWETRTAGGDWVGLGSRRLAILDLSAAGHMPMVSDDGSVALVYNGEVYNSPELREELKQRGHRFRSGTDTEVVLRLYEEEGPEFVRRLNGMFSIAIWDKRREHLFLARDHFGIKPLYYCHENRKFAFASEIKALFKVPGLPRRLNLTALDQYFTFLWVPDPLTMCDGILKLPAAHYGIFKDGQFTIKKFWDLDYPAAEAPYLQNERELALELRERFTRVVHSQMLSDVPLGAFLSAGLDSSSIVSAMSTNSAKPFRTYTVAFPDKYRRGEVTLDDTDVAKRTARHFSCAHTEIMVDPDVVSLLPKLVWHMDEPIADPAIITAYLVNREARKDVTVLLSGIGGDELFGGYRKYQAHYLAEKYRRIPESIRKRMIEPAVAALPSFRGRAISGWVRLAKKMVRSGSLFGRHRFLMDSVYMSEELKRELYGSGLRSQIDGIDPLKQHLSHFEHVADADFLNQMLYVDIKTFLVSLNLTYNDKMSMASSAEVRVPFLDWEFVEWTAKNIPPSLKLCQGTTKHILREAMRSHLPAEVLTQKKASFGAPVDYWLANELRPMVDDLLSPTVVRSRGLFEPRTVEKLIREQRSGREDWSMQIWQLLTLELWFREFMDKNQ